jgi:hypothetical protein
MKNIHIPNPCPEKWSDMSPTKAGAFCGKCATEVLDFSNLSPKEIKESLAKAMGQKVCAKMKPTQESYPEIPFEVFNGTGLNSFRRKFIYAFVMVFGLTAFGCESDNGYEGPVGMVQDVGMVQEQKVGDVDYKEDTINQIIVGQVLNEDIDIVAGKVEFIDSNKNETLDKIGKVELTSSDDD